MLATGIKNSILVFLIILILHFLIKNALFDKNVRLKERFIPTHREGQKEHPSQEGFRKETAVTVPVKENLVEEHVETKETFKNQNQKQEECGGTMEDDELYKYVYGDEGMDDAEISKYFKGMDVTKDVEENIQGKMKCTSLAEQNNVPTDVTKPISTTCDPSLQPPKPTQLPVKANCNLEQNLPIMVLNQYDNESTMNGGDMFGLSAYDTLAPAFESYECGNT